MIFRNVIFGNNFLGYDILNVFGMQIKFFGILSIFKNTLDRGGGWWQRMVGKWRWTMVGDEWL